MLAIEVRFLLGRYSASDFRDREKAEWPPHPARLFSAMVAAVYEAGLGESARAALLWLENLPAPHLHADESPAEQTPVTVFVPVNDPTDDLLPQRAEKQPRAFPSTIPGVATVDEIPAVWFVWPEAQPDPTLAVLLKTIADNVTYLGSSRSPVRVCVVEEPPAPNWVPDKQGEVLLRVPTKGRLQRLEWHFENGLRPPPASFQTYRCGQRETPFLPAESAFGEMVVFRLQGTPMEIETTLKLTTVLRAAVLRRAEESGIPEVLSGHDAEGNPATRTHAAYVALPFVSERQIHADGRVMGLAVVLPQAIEREERRRAMRALISLDHLDVGGVGRLSLKRMTVEDNVPVNLEPRTWMKPSDLWASVTPVLLDQFPRRGRTIEEIVARACTHIGLPRPIEVTASRTSPLHGVEPSYRFPTQRPNGKGRLFTHVAVTFAEKVRGPVLLGAGRYFGLGLLRPLEGHR